MRLLKNQLKQKSMVMSRHPRPEGPSYNPRQPQPAYGEGAGAFVRMERFDPDPHGGGTRSYTESPLESEPHQFRVDRWEDGMLHNERMSRCTLLSSLIR